MKNRVFLVPLVLIVLVAAAAYWHVSNPPPKRVTTYSLGWTEPSTENGPAVAYSQSSDSNGVTSYSYKVLPARTFDPKSFAPSLRH